ncbi:hypothetical protein [Bradyrhizobium sp.]|uniref:hypothetical protein n=1 Tax=Bradyrhizobium sp. TaxID=376 RepID=UPI003C5BB47E
MTDDVVPVGSDSNLERFKRMTWGAWHARFLIRTIKTVDHVWSMLRLAGERGRLAELSAAEWRDLGEHRVREELKKWPWQG